MLPSALLRHRPPCGLSGRDIQPEWPAVCPSPVRRISNQVLSVSTRSSIDDPFGASHPDIAPVAEHNASRPDRGSESERCSCGFGIEGSEHVYNEEAFRYFLEIERKRSALSNQPCLLL